MDSMEKPFKTIEVVDSRTSQACKVACMSCIRGHRTTSCGIPVCRSKIFWTVKRPGRPSNSCTCRYGGGGGCKCVVAASKASCPHKAKKGEKRSGECRCDEQGRYCCLLDSEHWVAVFALQKPTVEFFSTREALEVRITAPSAFTAPSTPTHAAPGPHYLYGAPQTAMSLNGAQTLYGSQSQAIEAQTQVRSPVQVRFQMMGIGGPQGTGPVLPDPMAWEGQAPLALRPYRQAQHQLPPQQEEPSCCQASSAMLPAQMQQNAQYILPDHVFTSPPPGSQYDPLVGVIPKAASIATQIPPSTSFDYNKMTADYFSYQLPNAICQNCGLSGCTCRHCPPVLQNFSNGSWAQCCGRKHARDVPPALSLPPVPANNFMQQFSHMDDPTFAVSQNFDILPQFNTDLDRPSELAGLLSPATTSDLTHFELDTDISLPLEVSAPMSLSDFLLCDLENPEKDQTMGEGDANNEEEDSGGGGCGCGC